MVKQSDIQDALTAFELHLDVYGARRERWPDAARRHFDPLLAQEPKARQLMAEARALDQLLETAPSSVSTGKLDALSARIAGLAAAEADTATTNVVDLSRARPSRQVMQSRFGGSGSWRMASALAASLIVGIYLGTAPEVMFAVETIAESVGLADAAETGNLALFDDSVSGADEEFL